MDFVESFLAGTSLKDIANSNNCTVDKVRYQLIKHGVFTPKKPGRVELPELDVIALYKDDVSIEDIAQRYGVSVSPVIKVLTKHKIRKPVWAKMLPYKTYEQINDVTLFSKIASDLQSKRLIAEHFGINYDMVASICKRYNIVMPPSSADVRSLQNRKTATTPFTQDAFNELFFIGRLPMIDIAKNMNVSVAYLTKTATETWKIELSRDDIRWSEEFTLLVSEVSHAPHILADLVKDKTVHELAIQYKVSYDTIRKLITDHNIELPLRYRSSGEKEIERIVRDCVGNDILVCDRKTIYPYELDIVIPSKNIAIEYCGLYWHSELQNKTKEYHIAKLNACEQKGIRLLTVFEDELHARYDQVISRILQCLGTRPAIKINARECDVKVIDSSTKNTFLEKYHIQGKDISKIYLGLYHNNVVVAVMTFATPSRARSSGNNTDGVWELNRYATDITYSVRGGAGKLLKYFKTNYTWNKIYSYADRRWSTGDMYYKLGFRLSGVSAPNYWYLPKGYYKRMYRYDYTKYKLVQQGFDPSKTEREIMAERGFTRIWDCGMLKFEICNNA